MASKTKKKYTDFTKAVLMPDGTRKYIRAKTREELDEKVLQAQILVKSGVDICSEETFGHFAQMWFDIYKKPYLREKNQDAIKYVLNHQNCPCLAVIVSKISAPCKSRRLWLAFLAKAIPYSQRF